MTDSRFNEIRQITESMESPFKLFPNDSHKQILASDRTSKEEAAWLLSNGSVGELEKSILKAVALMNFTTTRQLFNYLVRIGQITLADLEKVRERAIWLWQKSFLNRLHFISNNAEQHSFPCFYLGYHGVGCLRAMGIRAYDQPYINAMDTWKIKRILAASQIMISIITGPNERIRPSLLLSCNTAPDAFVKPQYILCGSHVTYLIEAVRNTDNWQQQLDQKLQRYGKVIKNYQQISAISTGKPQLLITFESQKQMQQFAASNITPFWEQSRVYCTFDRAVHDNPANAFVCADKLLPRRFYWNTLFA